MSLENIRVYDPASEHISGELWNEIHRFVLKQNAPLTHLLTAKLHRKILDEPVQGQPRLRDALYDKSSGFFVHNPDASVIFVNGRFKQVCDDDDVDDLHIANQIGESYNAIPFFFTKDRWFDAIGTNASMLVGQFIVADEVSVYDPKTDGINKELFDGIYGKVFEQNKRLANLLSDGVDDAVLMSRVGGGVTLKDFLFNSHGYLGSSRAKSAIFIDGRHYQTVKNDDAIQIAREEGAKRNSLAFVYMNNES